MSKVIKTNAMRILDAAGISYVSYTYQAEDGKIDGVSVAEKIGIPSDIVYKTLVTIGKSKDNYVFVIPVTLELDLKKAAAAVGEKAVEMIMVKDLLKTTGYIRGGCSPIGMKSKLVTVFEESAMLTEDIVVSGGMIGLQLQMKVSDLITITEASFADIIK
ncbi:MAG: Cys-tRNA(Pro) deacylase [Clostridia bacterium]|nr:Cys-tRNA(Pro) deacylase [Clostridia bacterium]